MKRRNFLTVLPLAAGALATLFRSNSLVTQPELARVYGRHATLGRLQYAGRPLQQGEFVLHEGMATTAVPLSDVQIRAVSAIDQHGRYRGDLRLEQYRQRKAAEDATALLYSDTEPTIFSTVGAACSLSVRQKG